MPLKIYEQEFTNCNANVNILANKINVTPRWLYEQTIRETGKTPSEYLEELRLQAALPLLQSGESLEKVSIKVGYNYTKTFSQAFKRRFGITPGKWAKENPPPSNNRTNLMTIQATSEIDFRFWGLHGVFYCGSFAVKFIFHLFSFVVV